MEESILKSIKKLLGIPDLDTAFDLDICIYINTVFMTLEQLGVGPETIFSIQNADATWNDFFEDKIDLEGVKTYTYLKVKMLFDPPASSAVMEAYKQQVEELEWRLNLNAEHPHPISEKVEESNEPEESDELDELDELENEE